MKKILFISLTVIVITLLSFSGCAEETTSGPAAGTIKIGYMSSLSGPFAAVEQFTTPAVQMVIDNVNAAGGINGRQLELVMRDDQGDPSIASVKLNELKAAGIVIGVGPLLDPMAEVIAQWALDNKIPWIITNAATMSLSTTKFNKYEFHTKPNPLALARIYAKEISKQDITTIYEIGADMLLAHEVYDFFWQEIKKVKPSVTEVGANWVGGFEMEFSNIISAALAKNPDMIMSGVAGPPWVSLVQQAQRFNLFDKTKVSGNHLLGSDLTTPFGDAYPTGIQGPTWCPFWLDEKPMKDFRDAYLARTKLYPADITIEYYLAAMAAVEALKKAGNTNADSLVSALEKITIDGPTGKLHFRDFDHQLVQPVWWATTGYVAEYPIAIGLNMTKYQEEVYPTKDEILALRSAK
ncbi:MAG: hypothetical protein A2Z29_10355 [Chloroflexi bacterium RBG_16_56_11]|nr:MAG: hypothetical protein A2Z29_10355 [Chloroflexi bacterium RBG_16_56_11]HJX13953.1 ABC transporter substrate-binding protein [Dehalococcoidales bacterium]